MIKPTNWSSQTWNKPVCEICVSGWCKLHEQVKYTCSCFYWTFLFSANKKDSKIQKRWLLRKLVFKANLFRSDITRGSGGWYSLSGRPSSSRIESTWTWWDWACTEGWHPCSRESNETINWTAEFGRRWWENNRDKNWKERKRTRTKSKTTTTVETIEVNFINRLARKKRNSQFWF